MTAKDKATHRVAIRTMVAAAAMDQTSGREAMVVVATAETSETLTAVVMEAAATAVAAMVAA